MLTSPVHINDNIVTDTQRPDMRGKAQRVARPVPVILGG